MKLSILAAQALLSTVLAAPVSSKQESGKISVRSDGSLFLGNANVAPSDKVLHLAKRRYDDCYEEPEPPRYHDSGYEPERHHYYDDDCYEPRHRYHDDDYEPRRRSRHRYDDEDEFPRRRHHSSDCDSYDNEGEDGRDGCCCGGGGGGIFNAVREAACSLCPSNWCSGGGRGGGCCCEGGGSDRGGCFRGGDRGGCECDNSSRGNYNCPPPGHGEGPFYGPAPYNCGLPPQHPPPGYGQPGPYYQPPPPQCYNHVPPQFQEGPGPMDTSAGSAPGQPQAGHPDHRNGPQPADAQPNSSFQDQPQDFPQGQAQQQGQFQGQQPYQGQYQNQPPQDQQPLPQNDAGNRFGPLPQDGPSQQQQQHRDFPMGLSSADVVRGSSYQDSRPPSRYRDFYEDDYYPSYRAVENSHPRARHPYLDYDFMDDPTDYEDEDDVPLRQSMRPKTKSSRKQAPSNKKKVKAPVEEEQDTDVEPDSAEDDEESDDVSVYPVDNDDIHFDVSVQRKN